LAILAGYIFGKNKGEKKLEMVKGQVQSQAADIDAVFRVIDSLKAFSLNTLSGGTRFAHNRRLQDDGP
jgi:hypothetical protein